MISPPDDALREEEAQRLELETISVLNLDLDSLMKEIGDDVADVIMRVYWGGATGVASARDTIYAAAERVAAKRLGMQP